MDARRLDARRCGLPVPGHHSDVFAFEGGDTPLLYTDGVIEARSPEGEFHPLAERVASFPRSGPEALLERLRRDLVAHTGGPLGDDAAMLAVERASSEVIRP